jgi:hypothetical protein|tara:strand:- start:658 stop:921 length:264 start_codon:yes stop_codon:yes gene_type:complete
METKKETTWSRKAEEIWLEQSDAVCDRGTNDPGDRWFWWSSDRLYRLYTALDRLERWTDSIEERPIVCGLIAAGIGLAGGLIVGANI